MDSGHMTTPFGRRSVTLGMLATQMMSRQIDPAKTVDKWKIYRALCEAGRCSALPTARLLF